MTERAHTWQLHSHSPVLDSLSYAPSSLFPKGDPSCPSSPLLLKLSPKPQLPAPSMHWDQRALLPAESHRTVYGSGCPLRKRGPRSNPGLSECPQALEMLHCGKNANWGGVQTASVARDLSASQRHKDGSVDTVLHLLFFSLAAKMQSNLF